MDAWEWLDANSDYTGDAWGLLTNPRGMFPIWIEGCYELVHLSPTYTLEVSDASYTLVVQDDYILEVCDVSS